MEALSFRMASLPSCVVCDHPFKYVGPTPHLLPCLHSVCSLCLTSTVVQTVTCRVCERQYDIDGQDYPVSHVVLADVLHLTSENRPSEITCTNKEDGHQAVCWCQECSDYLCEHCQTSHLEVKITRRHTLHKLTEVAGVLKDIQLTCSDHGLPKNLYDNKCDCFICSQCFVSQHESHKTTAASEVKQHEDVALRETIKSVSDKKEEVQDAIARVNEHEETINERFSTRKDTVEHAFSELKTHMDQREKMVLMELDHLKNCMQSANNSRRPLLKALDTSCQTILDFNNKCLTYTPAEHLVQMKKSMEEAKHYCLEGKIPNVHQHEASVSFLKQGMKEVKNTISTFGCFVTALHPSGLPDCSTPFQCVTTNIMKKQIEDYKDKYEQSSKDVNSLTEKAAFNQNRLLALCQTISQQETVLKKIGNDCILEKSCFRIVKSQTGSMQVIKLEAMAMDSERTYIDFEVRDGCFLEPIKTPYYKKKKGFNMLQNYHGTSASTPLPLHSNSISPRAASYWEVEVELDMAALKKVRREITGNILIFEVAVCDESAMDTDFYTGTGKRSCSLFTVFSMKTKSVEMIFCKEYEVKVDTVNLVNSLYFNFGVLWDANSRKVTFLDCKKMEVLGSGTLPEDCTSVWPMFNICSATRSMKLVSGVDIKRDTAKEALISKVLSG